MNTQKKLEILKKVSKNGKIFSVSFVKKDGTQREMTVRAGVKKYLRGGENTVAHIPKYVTLFSINDNNYRNVNLETLMKIKGCNQEYNFEEIKKKEEA